MPLRQNIESDHSSICSHLEPRPASPEVPMYGLAPDPAGSHPAAGQQGGRLTRRRFLA
jgi:hypothetical protein